MKRILFALSLIALLTLNACEKSETEVVPMGNEVFMEENGASAEPEAKPSAEEDEPKTAGAEPSDQQKAPSSDEPERNDQKPVLGWIEGSVSYPSEGLPDDLEVCAAQVEGGNEMYCTSQWIEDQKYTYGFGYKLAVPPGTYQVMAQRSGGGLMGWYSVFVTCGQTAECTDHAPLDVEVKAGEGVEEIDPADWYDGN